MFSRYSYKNWRVIVTRDIVTRIQEATAVYLGRMLRMCKNNNKLNKITNAKMTFLTSNLCFLYIKSIFN